jgi:hypothetical protein
MTLDQFSALIIMVLFVAAVLAVRRRGRRGAPGIGASGAVYDMLNADRRRGIEIIAEERAEYRDPESADDAPPDEEVAGRRRRSRGRPSPRADGRRAHRQRSDSSMV